MSTQKSAIFSPSNHLGNHVRAMNIEKTNFSGSILVNLDNQLPNLEALYKDLHSLQIRLFGRGAHGSMPQASIDPVIMAAATVMRLQTIVSRELAATESAVVTIGSLQAGTKENVIPDEAIIKLNVRAFDEGVRQHVLSAIGRIVNAESFAKILSHHSLLA